MWAAVVAVASFAAYFCFLRPTNTDGQGDRLQDGRPGNSTAPLFVRVPEVLPGVGPDEVLEFIKRFSATKGWGMYSSEGLTNGFGEARPRADFPDQKCPTSHAISLNKSHCILRERMDHHLYVVTTGGRHRRKLSYEELAKRNDYFRETLAYGSTRKLADPVVELIFHNPAFIAAAKQVYGVPLGIVEPSIIYANFILPGQELAVHTDVPEFRGANRKGLPQWLLVAMHRSQLFERWRMPIATGVSWWTNRHQPQPEDGDMVHRAFVMYPQGVHAKPTVWNVRFNQGVVLDTDTIFHGVDEVNGSLVNISEGMRLSFNGSAPDSEAWIVLNGADVVARFSFEELRLSISWKAYVFGSAAERDLWQSHKDDLNLTYILNLFRSDLEQRGALPANLDMESFGYLLIKQYILYPT